MQPGRELDALIAEKVMGWTEIPGEQGMNQFGMGLDLSHWKQPDGNLVRFRKLPHFSTDIAAAWEVVEKLRLNIFSDFPEQREWHASKGMCDDFGCGPKCGTGTTAPHAICLAAIKMTGICID